MRCSRCKHAFFLAHPEHSDHEGVEAVVAQAVRTGAPAPPQATRDLTVTNPNDSAPAQTSAAANDDGFIDDEEDDWQFNEDLPPFDEDENDVDGAGFAADALGHDDENDMSIELADDPDDDEEADDSRGLSSTGEEETDDDEMSANDLMSSRIAVERDAASPFDVVGDEDDDIEIETPLADDDDEVMPETLEDVREAAFGIVEDFSNPATREEGAAPVDLTAGLGGDDNVEDPESWDFFSDSSPTHDAPCTPQDPFGAALPNAAGLKSERDDLEDAMASQDWPTLGKSGAVSAAGRIFNALGWVLVCSLIGLGAMIGLRDTLDPSVHAPSFVSIGEMRAANVQGQWVETAGLGTLYVVSGDLLNPGTRAIVPNVAIEVRLMDEAGPVTDWPVAQAGSGIDFDVLRTLPESALAQLRDRALRELAWGQIPGGASVRFAAVFESLPDTATHFKLEAIALEAPAPATVLPESAPETPAVDVGLDAEPTPELSAGAAGEAA